MATTAQKSGSWKRFMLIYVAAYILIGLVINRTFGPPAMSDAFLEDHKAEHDRYLEITKDPVYRHWQQRPELNPPDPQLAEAIGFVENYTAMPEFVAEQARRGRYELVFDFFNVGMVVLLVVRFARTPLAQVLDDMAGKVRHELGRAREAREAASARQDRAHKMISGLEKEDERLQSGAEERVAETRRDIEALTERSLSLLELETEDRRNHEEGLARQALKRELVDGAIAVVSDQLRTERSAELESALVDEFAAQLEGRS